MEDNTQKIIKMIEDFREGLFREGDIDIFVNELVNFIHDKEAEIEKFQVELATMRKCKVVNELFACLHDDI